MKSLKDMFDNPILLTDSYKGSHAPQYPPDSEYIYSYWEPRGGFYDEIVFNGLQFPLMRYLSRPITREDVNQAEEYFNAHLGPNVFNRQGWDLLVDKHGGKLPLRIKAVPEGTVIRPLNAMMTVENTDPDFPWLTNYAETLLSLVWYPTTVATQSRYLKKLIARFLEETGDPSLINFKLHDFGMRGVSSIESGAIGGCAHLINFMGTDTVSALIMAREVYDCKMAGFSIPAAEHSTITSWGRENELKAFRNMINRYGGKGTAGGGLYAVVSDSFNVFEACKAWAGELLQEVLDAPNMLVVRPDSGVPHEVVLKVLDILSQGFGTTTNAKGFKVLNRVRVIQGDGVNKDEIERILTDMKNAGWSADNIAFGMGGALLQKLDRDTLKCAFKASYIAGRGWERDISKSPITDPGKISKKGKFRVIKDEDGYHTVPQSQYERGNDILELVYENGTIWRHQTLDDIRERAKI